MLVFDNLTYTQKEFLKLIGMGYNDVYLAQHINTSFNKLELYLKNLYKEFDLDEINKEGHFLVKRYLLVIAIRKFFHKNGECLDEI